MPHKCDIYHDGDYNGWRCRSLECRDYSEKRSALIPEAQRNIMHRCRLKADRCDALPPAEFFREMDRLWSEHYG